MNFLPIIASLLGVVRAHSANGQPTPNPVLDALQKALDALAQFQAAYAGLKPIISVQTAVDDAFLAISAVEKSGYVPADQHLADVLSLIEKYNSTKANFEGGQYAEAFTFNYQGKKAHVGAFLDGGPAAASLGL